MDGPGSPSSRAVLALAEGRLVMRQSWFPTTVQSVLVCGGRTYGVPALLTVYDSRDEFRASFERSLLRRTLDDLAPAMVIHGGARGADLLAAKWADSRGVSVVEVQADWHEHGRAAGPRRNAQLLALRPDVILAFGGGRGTENLIGQALRVGYRVVRYRYPDSITVFEPET